MGAGALRRFVSRAASLVWPGRDEARLEREVQSHLLLLEDEYRRRGMTADDARRAARIALGGIDQTKERHRDARAFRWLDDARRDAAYAVRMLKRSPVAAATAVLSLAIGIGLNAAVFSVVDWVILRPLPYPAPHELVHVVSAGTAPVTGPNPLVYAEFDTFRNAPSLRGSAVFSSATRVMSANGVDPIHVVVARIAGDLFSTLGVAPEIGRAFTASELSAGAPLIVLGRDLWQRHFAGDRSIAGRTVSIDGAPYTVIGVIPRGRGYPAEAELWRPLTASEHEDDDRELNMIGRLRGDATAEEASVELGTLAKTMSTGSRTAWADDVQRRDAGHVRSALQVLLGAALLTLLVACANVAALVGARGADRAGEIAVRSALGASRARVLGQLLTESLVLALTGGVIGLLAGRWALEALVALAPVGIPRLAEISLDSRIIGVGLAATLITGVAVGLAPALRLSRTGTLNRAGWQRATARSSAGRALVLAQVAVAVVLTAGAGLLARSLMHLVAIDHGFAPDRLVAVELNLRGLFSGDARQLFRDLMTQSESVPGVESAAWAMRLPTQVPGLRTTITIAGESPLKTPATLRLVSASYFDAVQLPLTAGRHFASSDTIRAAKVGIVNATFVRDFLGGRAPLDLRLTTTVTDDPITIVGVVGDVTPAGEADRPALYLPLDQLSTAGGFLIVRTRQDPRAIVSSLAARLRTTAPMLPVDRIRRVAEGLEESRAMVRFSTELAAAFAGLALLLAVIGVYGLTAGAVAARWRELAVRLALGATRAETLWTVTRPCLTLLAAGAVIGMLGAIGVGPALAAQLHGIDPRDAATVIAAPILLVVVGLVAAGLAARRVLRADPAATLRGE